VADYQLTSVRGGIDRLRTKGAAAKDVLFDLVNGYVTQDKHVMMRPGTFRNASLTTGTKGLCSFGDLLHVFAAESVAVPTGYELHIITHPDAGVTPIALEKIHFAKPFMGFLYVTAEFTNGDVYDFWLQSGDAWQASTVYKHGDIVVPSTPNGFSYQAQRLGAPNLSWAPGVTRAVSDVIEPTEYNDFYYTAVDVQGANPRSGETEPEWPTESGARVTEDADGFGSAGSTDTTTAPDNETTPNPDTVDRYGNRL
jgi:hypothetical protein